MAHWLKLNRLQRKVLLVILAMVVVPMLVAGAVASEWASSYFEARLAQWITEAARVDQIWLRSYQNDGLMLGQALAHDPVFRHSLQTGQVQASPALQQMARNLGISLWQVETRSHRVVYSSLAVRIRGGWDVQQTTALLNVRYHHSNVLAAVGITAVQTRHGLRYLVLGSLVNRDFITELGQLTGLTTRLYYRSGAHYYDVFSKPGSLVPLTGLSSAAWRRIGRAHKSFYDIAAANGRYRGLYVPVVDSAGRVEAILFSGLKRAGVDAFMTSRTALFLAISLAGLLIGGAAGVLLSRVVVRPIAHLRDAVLRLGGQDYRATVPISSNDELGDLGKAFNAMALRLQEARDEQQQAFQKDKLAALGEVAAALAHEIRNPIGVINTAGALLERSEDPAKNSELLRMIREESRRVSHLVQDFLQLSRHRQPNFQALDPAHPLKRALASVRAGQPELEIHESFGHGDLQIWADSDLLQQVWLNLLTNAVEAMGSSRGQLWLTSQVIGSRVLLTVEDAGPGIAPEVLPRLFEPFFTTKEQGTGLGLSIAHALVEANGGTLEAGQGSHGGARFSLDFAISEATHP